MTREERGVDRVGRWNRRIRVESVFGGISEEKWERTGIGESEGR